MERRKVPPPEIGKIVVEIWCYLQEVYTFGAESEIQEILSKKWEKGQFFIEILIKKSQNFLLNLSKLSSFLGQKRKVLQAASLHLAAQSKSFIRSRCPCIFL